MPPKKDSIDPKKLTIDTEWMTSNNRAITPRHIMEESGLMGELDGLWSKPLAKGYKKRKTFNVLRHEFKIIDIDSFGYHTWFQKLFKLPKSERTREIMISNVKFYLSILKVRIFEKRMRTILRFLIATRQLTEWCDTQRSGNYSIEGGAVMVEFCEWYFKYRHTPKIDNIYLSQYQHIRTYTSSWDYVMEIQGRYGYDLRQPKKPNDPMFLTTDRTFSPYREEIKLKSENYVIATNKTVAKSRLVTKVLSNDDGKRYVQIFNKLSGLGGTPQALKAQLRQYAILSFNYNIGLRGETIRTICYSWMKHHIVPMVAEGIYLNMGNPAGFKIRGGVATFRFAQLVIRHVDPRQCPVGALAKVLVAEHDILKEHNVLNQIEKAIAERERGERNPSPLEWETYRFLHGDRDTSESIVYSTYNTAYKGMYKYIGADFMEAITHEPHNRIGNQMQAIMGPNSTNAIALFNAWATKNQTEYDELYSLNLDAQGATARAGHRGCNFTPPIYDCPRDGLKDDFADFQDIYDLVFGNRVSSMLQRAKSLLSQHTDLHSAVLFLDLVNNFLIRVWLEDAAILQPIYRNSVCYKGHPVFSHPRWGELKKHLRELRNSRSRESEKEDASGRSNSSQMSSEGTASYTGFDYLHSLMRQRHASENTTIESLYTWRRAVNDEWKALNDDQMGRGIPNDVWIAAKAKNNENLYNDIARICKYIDNVVENPPKPAYATEEGVIEGIQAVVSSFEAKYEGFDGSPSRNFAETQFRILTSKPGESSKEKRFLKIKTKQELFEAFRKYQLPEPTREFLGEKT